MKKRSSAYAGLLFLWILAVGSRIIAAKVITKADNQ